MTIPKFNRESSLGPAIGIYRRQAVLRRLGTAGLLPTARFPSFSPLRQNQVVQSVGSIGRGSLSQAPAENCLSIHYIPECHQTGPFTECCTTRVEIRCTECISPTECCTSSEQFSCTECHSTVEASPTDGVFQH
jgi:hypothetical protein